MVIPNKRRVKLTASCSRPLPASMQATQSGAFLAATLRARPFFHPTALEIADVYSIHCALSALLDQKMDTGSDYLISMNRP